MYDDYPIGGGNLAVAILEVQAGELAEIYWIDFAVVAGTDDRWHVEVYHPSIGHDPRTKTYGTWAGCMKEIISPLKNLPEPGELKLWTT